MPIRPELPQRFDADDLIVVFGAQAYHKGVRMAVEALRAGDAESCRKLARANIELLRRGYHKIPMEDDAN